MSKSTLNNISVNTQIDRVFVQEGSKPTEQFTEYEVPVRFLDGESPEMGNISSFVILSPYRYVITLDGISYSDLKFATTWRFEKKPNLFNVFGLNGRSNHLSVSLARGEGMKLLDMSDWFGETLQRSIPISGEYRAALDQMYGEDVSSEDGVRMAVLDCIPYLEEEGLPSKRHTEKTIARFQDPPVFFALIKLLSGELYKGGPALPDGVRKTISLAMSKKAGDT